MRQRRRRHAASKLRVLDFFDHRPVPYARAAAPIRRRVINRSAECDDMLPAHARCAKATPIRPAQCPESAAPLDLRTRRRIKLVQNEKNRWWRNPASLSIISVRRDEPSRPRYEPNADHPRLIYFSISVTDESGPDAEACGLLVIACRERVRHQFSDS